MLQKTGHGGSNQPTNLLTEFFEGRCIGEGLVIDRLGRIRNRLHVEMQGYWKDGRFVLDEEFTYGDGTTELRLWKVAFGGDSTFDASCGDLAVPARGLVGDGEIRMDYRFAVTIAGRKHLMRFDDRMYRVGEETVLGRAKMKKFGIVLAEVFLVFRRKPG